MTEITLSADNEDTAFLILEASHNKNKKTQRLNILTINSSTTKHRLYRDAHLHIALSFWWSKIMTLEMVIFVLFFSILFNRNSYIDEWGFTEVIICGEFQKENIWKILNLFHI